MVYLRCRFLWLLLLLNGFDATVTVVSLNFLENLQTKFMFDTKHYGFGSIAKHQLRSGEIIKISLIWNLVDFVKCRLNVRNLKHQQQQKLRVTTKNCWIFTKQKRLYFPRVSTQHESKFVLIIYN